MKKLIVSVGLALALCLYAFAGCDAVGPQGDETAKELPPQPSVSEQLPPESGPEEEEPAGDAKGEESGPEQQEPALSPLAVLDTVDISAAFGDRKAEGWSFALKAAGDVDAAYGFSLTSEIGGGEKANLECGVGLGLEDLFGLRSDGGSALGVGLFGGGNANLSFRYRGPYRDSEPLSKVFDVRFRHDGDAVWYAEEGETETETSLSGLKEKLGAAVTAETFARMANAFAVIPEELSKGVSLRLAVEKLIDLGFAVEIDDTDGVSLSLKAGEGFYTGLLNDLLEELIPSEWLTYLPRADFAYEKTAFDLKLSFDENGIFKEYSMSSDVALNASLEVRNLFSCESGITMSGGISFTAYSGEIPAYGTAGSDRTEGETAAQIG